MASQKVFLNPRTRQEVLVTFRPFRPEDAAGFHACVEDYYRGGYPYTQYLDAGYLWPRIQEGRMAVLLGEDSSGTILSTTGVLFDSIFPGSSLLLLRVVREAFQGIGIGTWHEKLLFEELEKHRVCSLYADVMTQNTTSQTSLERRGFVTTGIRLLLYKANLMLPYRNYSAESRLSQAVMCRKGSLDFTPRLYCPRDLQEPISRIYRSLGVDAELLDVPLEKKKGLSAGSILTETWEEEHQSLIWVVPEIGEDFPEKLRQQTHRSGLQILVHLVYLNLCSPGAQIGWEALVREGYFFSGIKALGQREEYLMMTRLSGIPLNGDILHLTPQGQAFFRKIQELSPWPA